ncbi:MAG: hypothetical protein GY742_17515 [Hyphomicrobiales bacterium]|nr:hypothetical protein [Hyphomicrobiales bacterium]
MAVANTGGQFSGNVNAGTTNSAMTLAAGNCAAKANSLVSSYSNAQILSVTQDGNSCTIVIKVNGNNGEPPRIIRKKVSG